MIFVYALLALFVAFIWFDYFRRIDIFEKVSPLHFIAFFFAGVISTLPILFQSELHISLPADVIGIKTGREEFDLLITIFLNIGLIEEIAKLTPVLLLFIIKPKMMTEPMHWIIFAAASALGFATLENILYFSEGSPINIGLRSLLTPIGHVFDSTLAIYGVIIFLYHPIHKGKTKYIFLYFLFGVLLHTAYDYPLLLTNQGNNKLISFLLAILVYLYGMSLFINMVNNCLNNSTGFTYKKYTNPFIIEKRILRNYIILFIGLLFIDTNVFIFCSAFVFILMPLLMILSKRISRLKLISFRWEPLRLELPFHQIEVTSGREIVNQWVVRGDSGNEVGINALYQDYFHLHPFSKRNTWLGKSHIAYVKEKIYFNNDRGLYLINVYDGDQFSNHEPMLIESKKKGASETTQGYPICALYIAPKIDDLASFDQKKQKLQFVEWVILKPMT